MKRFKDMTPDERLWQSFCCQWCLIAAAYGRFPCAICSDVDVENILRPGDLCDGCWYGMRLRPDEWEAEMKERGIEVERTGGCEQFITEAGAVGICCSNPYSKAKP